MLQKFYLKTFLLGEKILWSLGQAWRLELTKNAISYQGAKLFGVECENLVVLAIFEGFYATKGAKSGPNTPGIAKGLLKDEWGSPYAKLPS